MKYIKRILSYNLIFILLYRFALDWHYFALIYPKFETAFRDNRTLSALVLSWVVLIASYYLIKKSLIKNSENLSSLVIYILYLISFVPFTTCIYAGMATHGFIVYNIVYWLAVFICWRISNLSISKRSLHIKINGMSKKTLFIIISIIAIGLIVYVSGRYAHFRFITDLFNVYDIREEAASYNYSTLTSYLLSWTVAINPMIMGVCFIRKKWVLVAMSLAVQMLSFGIDGRKTTFFMPFLVIAILMLYRSSDVRQLKNLITAGISILTGFGIIEYFLFKTTFISDFGVRRVMIIPNQLGEYYYDFFTSNVPDYFRSSFLRHFGFHSPYQGGGLNGFTYQIAAYYFRKQDMNANNGLASDGLANLGLAGCIIMPILLVVALKLLDKSSRYLDKRLLIVVAIYISYNLLSTTLMTCLLTHGLIMMMMVLPLLENSDDERIKPIEQYAQKKVT